MADHKVSIMAKTVEEFAKIEASLAQLPKAVYEQIESARNHVNLELQIKDIWELKQLYLPFGIGQQVIHNGIVHIYFVDKARKLDCRFVLTEKQSEKPIQYSYVDMPELKTEDNA